MFSNKLDVGNVYVFKVEIIIITFKFYSSRITKKKIQIFDPKILASFLLFTFLLEFALFFPNFPPLRIAKLRKFETKNIC
jgi:hypothetical protein